MTTNSGTVEYNIRLCILLMYMSVLITGLDKCYFSGLLSWGYSQLHLKEFSTDLALRYLFKAFFVLVKSLGACCILPTMQLSLRQFNLKFRCVMLLTLSEMKSWEILYLFSREKSTLLFDPISKCCFRVSIHFIHNQCVKPVCQHCGGNETVSRWLSL